MATILQEIQKWSEELPAWQQHAIAKIYAQGELTQQDHDDVYALLKAAHKIADPENRAANKLAAGEVAVQPAVGQHIQIGAIKNLSNVNALAGDQRLSLSVKGLTVIYGENGSGKSGYSRVFKHACRARDRREPILPNANEEPGKAGPPQATFELHVDGVEHEVQWQSGQVSPAELSSIAIFDSHCARAYLDNHGDFAYVPYGLDILKKLVDTLGTLKAMATKEHGQNTPDSALFAELGQTKTKVGTLLSALSAKTKPADVDALAMWSEEKKAEHAKIVAALSEADPKLKAQTLRNQATRFEGLATRIDTAIALVDDTPLVVLVAAVHTASVAKDAAELASKAFRETPGQLPGTGEEAWKKLFKAARSFAAESHPGKKFPHLGPESACPLCQNTLGAEGAERLVMFDEFVERKTEQEAKTAKDAADVAISAIKLANLDLLIDEILNNEIAARDQALAEGCAGIQKWLTDRRSSMLAACLPAGDWANLVQLIESPAPALVLLKDQLIAEADALEATLDEAGRAKMIADRDELDACRRLSELKAAVMLAIEKHVLTGKLSSCMTAAGGTTPISKKATTLSDTMATKEVVAALNAELESLNVHELKVVMKPASAKGKAQFKLALEMLGKRDATEILSEGEQRAIAIASFLAEVGLGKGLGGMVFDDPVSSLDHSRREYVARRIAKEALSRQVIVFTHDLFFLNVLVHEARSLDMEPACRSLRRAPAGYGVADESMPFEGASTKDRVGILRVMLVAATKLHKEGEDKGYKREARDIYAHLRMSWERAVEELLFNNVVLRFRKGVETNRLSKVTVAPADVETIMKNMGKCSNYTGHDGAIQANLAIPLPPEIEQDIKVLDDWRKAASDRLNKKK
ncbi:energy-coupling factor transporter ATP-binding protein EcfA2 [Duganella sp. 1411]|uniref:AAA family ATPase n=1 Tax=Duganella sp. 1411 TaxID=2806572 RepID=UPI001AE501E2|nr:AAA family ATPase [Duganella sp. 1411]MBP1203644.1 energy-coupling factor transporter ATP-binding protein EcfA2 [Duganella sp. 1411]